MRLISIAPLVIGAIGLTVVGYGLYRRQAEPARVVSTGTFEFKDKLGTSLIFAKRVVAVAGFETTEVQLPGGTWIDCRGDCGKVIRDEHTEIWDARRDRR